MTGFSSVKKSTQLKDGEAKPGVRLALFLLIDLLRFPLYAGILFLIPNPSKLKKTFSSFSVFAFKINVFKPFSDLFLGHGGRKRQKKPVGNCGSYWSECHDSSRCYNGGNLDLLRRLHVQGQKQH